jgi:hypothetical protein
VAASLLECAPTDVSSVEGVLIPTTGSQNGTAILDSKSGVKGATGNASRTDNHNSTSQNKCGGMSRDPKHRIVQYDETLRIFLTREFNPTVGEPHDFSREKRSEQHLITPLFD